METSSNVLKFPTTRKEHLQRLVALIDEHDGAPDEETFRKIVSMAIGPCGIHTSFIAFECEVSGGVVSRWATGNAHPIPIACEYNAKKIKELAQRELEK